MINLLFNEVDVVDKEFHINPAFLVVYEMFYDPNDNAVVIYGRDDSEYVAPMSESKYAQFVDNFKYADKNVDVRHLALFVNSESDDYDKLIEYSREKQTF